MGVIVADAICFLMYVVGVVLAIYSVIDAKRAIRETKQAVLPAATQEVQQRQLVEFHDNVNVYEARMREGRATNCYQDAFLKLYWAILLFYNSVMLRIDTLSQFEVIGILAMLVLSLIVLVILRDKLARLAYRLTVHVLTQ